MISFEIDGVVDLQKALRAVGKKAAREAALVAVQHGTEPMVRVAKAKARRKTGALADSITARVKQYRRGEKIVGVIGPASKFRGPDGSRPALYAHLQERGHLSRNGKWVSGDGFMRQAADIGGPEAGKKVASTFGAALKIKTEQLAEVRAARKAARRK